MLDNIKNRVVKILKRNVELINFDTEKISIETNLFQLGLNSVTFIKLIVDLEREFDIEFEETYLDYDKFTDILSIIEYIQTKLNLSTRF